MYSSKNVNMLPLLLAKWIILMVFVIRVAAKHHLLPAGQQPNSNRLSRIEDFPFDSFFIQKEITGNGNILAHPKNIDFDYVVGNGISNVAAGGGHNPANFFNVWLQHQHQQQHQRQQQTPSQRPNFLIRNGALPFPKQPRHSYANLQAAKSDENSADQRVNIRGSDADNVESGNGNESDNNYDENSLYAIVNKGEEGNYYDGDAADDDDIGNMLATTNVVPTTIKRSPKPIGTYWAHTLKSGHKHSDFGEPRYPYAVVHQYNSANKQDSDWSPNRAYTRNYKRKKAGAERMTFLPSISAGAMTNLGQFFRDLSKNIQFTEQSQLGEDEEKLLDGDHPLRLLHEQMTNSERGGNPAKTAEFLHAIRSYRPSQKIRSLVSMNPRGYHGSQFLDPNYMWVGLGK